MIRVATFNVNGVRAAWRRGLHAWLASRSCDVVALQEMRCPPDLVPSQLSESGHLRYDAGALAGRNGVAVLSRTEPLAVRTDFGSVEFAHEGRYLEVDLPTLGGGTLTVASLYLPKGGRPDTEPERHERKMRFLTDLGAHLSRVRTDARATGRHYLLLGDLNIAPTRLDLKTWAANRLTPGFLPEEREWFAGQLAGDALVDVVRALHPDQPGPYSWWSWRGRSWTGDAGWRIDFHLATPGLAARAVAGGTDRDETYEGRMSDHAPVVVDYDVDLA